MDMQKLSAIARNIKGIAIWAAAVAGSVASTPASAGDHYSYTPFNVPGSGYTAAFGINNRGDIVGDYADATSNYGFLRDRDGSFTKINLPGGNTATLGINDQRQVVGAYGDRKGYVRDPDGDTTIIEVPGSKLTVVFSINNRGEMVGEYDDANNVRHGFFRDSHGTFHTVDVPGATQTELLGINNWEEIVGSYNDSRNMQHAFLLSPTGVLTAIAEARADYTEVFGLNDLGQIVGDTNLGGFLLDADLTTFTPIGVPKAGSTRPNGINNRGEIVGLFSYGSGADQGFFAIPCRGFKRCE
jgi:hypothetical protein